MKHIYSVGQVNHYIKRIFDEDFLLRRIYVKGEVSNCKYHTSGHIYFSLKDETGNLSCVMFAGSRRGLAFPMKDGQSVIALGRVNVFPRDGKYQLYAEEILLDGAGLLYERFEALKKELEEMGMFAGEYKLPIPAFPRRIGIVTAPTGAAIRDIMNISHRRNPYVQLILYPALVQGEYAAESIVKGIHTLSRAGVDVIIAGRGGGSIEDLWAFNERIVAEAIFSCPVPVISAVGHETDFTIADFVSDLRAPTPSAAAELAVPDVSLILKQLADYMEGLKHRMAQHLSMERWKIDSLRQKLLYQSPENQIREKRQILMNLEEGLEDAMQRNIKEKRHQMQILAERMKGVSPLEKLTQGYSYTSDENGKTVTTHTQVASGDTVAIYVSDGKIRAKVTGTEELRYR